MRFKELPPTLYNGNGNKISYVYDTKTNEYIDIAEFQADKDKMKELVHLFEQRTVSGINRRIVTPPHAKAQ